MQELESEMRYKELVEVYEELTSTTKRLEKTTSPGRHSMADISRYDIAGTCA